MATPSPICGPDRIVRESECRGRTGLSRMTRYRMMQRGEFPLKRRISPSVSGWLESELGQWLASRETIAVGQPVAEAAA